MQDFTPEQQRQLGNLHARMVLETRYSAPPPDEADQWSHSFLDLDHEGRTFYNISVWHPRALVDQWTRLRFGIDPATGKMLNAPGTEIKRAGDVCK